MRYGQNCKGGKCRSKLYGTPTRDYIEKTSSYFVGFVLIRSPPPLSPGSCPESESDSESASKSASKSRTPTPGTRPVSSVVLDTKGRPVNRLLIKNVENFY